ncbi:MAG: hypothetical protein DI537_62455, partial [Stutzerimonas stutzeri]
MWLGRRRRRRGFGGGLRSRGDERDAHHLGGFNGAWLCRAQRPGQGGTVQQHGGADPGTPGK